jgi:glutamate synthase (NADPH/NADH) large chain
VTAAQDSVSRCDNKKSLPDHLRDHLNEEFAVTADAITPASGHPLADLHLRHDACGTGLLIAKSRSLHGDIVKKGLVALARMSHRGGDVGDSCSDGSGIMIEIPWNLILEDNGTDRDSSEKLLGCFFLASVEADREQQLVFLSSVAESCGLSVTKIRTVPMNRNILPAQSSSNCPCTVQLAFSYLKSDSRLPLTSIRLIFIEACQNQQMRFGQCKVRPVLVSLSDRTVVYKGLINGTQLPRLYPDLQNPELHSQFAIFHQRFATNTNPDWELAQPFEHLAHNGEINTIRANTERLMSKLQVAFPSSPHSGKIAPATWFSGNQSDSRIMNLALLALMHEGLPLEAGVSSLIAPLEPKANPAASSSSSSKGDPVAADIEAISAMQRNLYEIWDGPAAIVFSDGRRIGAARDRNGLRPLRLMEDDDFIGIASETGVFEFTDESLCRSRHLEPGEIVMFDPSIKRTIEPLNLQQRIMQSIKQRTSQYEWQAALTSHLDLPPATAEFEHGFFGYFKETATHLYQEVMANGSEPISSMGNDAALPMLSPLPKSFFDYFRQQFAQVTNPPIDPVREKSLFNMTSYFGAGLTAGADDSDQRQIRTSLASPILKPGEVDACLTAVRNVVTFDLTYPRNLNLTAKVDLFCNRIDDLVKHVGPDVGLVLITDESVSKSLSAFPVLLAAAAIHTRLIQSGQRQSLGLIAASGQIRSSHDSGCLLTLGCDAVFPSALYSYCVAHRPNSLSVEQVLSNCHEALVSGLRKVMSRCGISQFSSYKSCSAVDAMGLSHDLCRTWIGQVSGRYGRLGLVEVIREQDDLFESYARLETTPFERRKRISRITRWSAFGEKRSYNPDTISALRTAVLRDSPTDFKRYTELLEKQDKAGLNIRGLLVLKPANERLPVAQTETIQEILSRMSIGAMSVGALSPEAHLTLARAAKELGIKSNSGEGGEGTKCPSFIRQVASGRFGVTLAYLSDAQEIQIKIAQGAKPGEGGQLPAKKVTEEIAGLRHTQPGIGLISPPPHHDIYSIEDLKQLIFDLRRANPTARIGVKLVSSVGVGHIAVGVAKAGADSITIAGHDGGTGAAPLHSIYHVGEPWEIGLVEAHDELNANGLRHKIRLVVDGQIRSGRDIILASILGADEFSLATATLVSLGCMLMRKCHLNTCPVGIATQDEMLRNEFSGQSIHVIRLFRFIAEDVRETLARLGVRSLGELRAQRNLLTIDTSKLSEHWKTRRVDVRQLLFATMTPYSKPKVQIRAETRCTFAEDAIIKDIETRINGRANRTTDALGTSNFEKSEGIATSDMSFTTLICNSDLTFGAGISSLLYRKLPEFLGKISIACHGTAGQSFGAFLTPQLSLTLFGAANDGVGKGLCGGTIAIRSPFTKYPHKDQTLTGNACFYGATSGSAFIGGRAGDRFAVRNSGATLVADSVGEHGCEYMTGGTVVILADHGKNLCAGMTGGEVYFFAAHEALQGAQNESHLSLVSKDAAIETTLTSADEQVILALLSKHWELTGSATAQEIMQNWDDFSPRLRRAIPAGQSEVLVANAYKLAASENKFAASTASRLGSVLGERTKHPIGTRIPTQLPPATPSAFTPSSLSWESSILSLEAKRPLETSELL